MADPYATPCEVCGEPSSVTVNGHGGCALHTEEAVAAGFAPLDEALRRWAGGEGDRTAAAASRRCESCCGETAERLCLSCRIGRA